MATSSHADTLEYVGRKYELLQANRLPVRDDRDLLFPQGTIFTVEEETDPILSELLPEVVILVTEAKGQTCRIRCGIHSLSDSEDNYYRHHWRLLKD